MPDGVHQVRLAQADAAEDIERIAFRQRPVLLGDIARGGIGELVGLADHEIVEGVARLRTLEDLVGAAADRGAQSRHRLLEVLRRGYRRHGDDVVGAARRRAAARG
jgi:hypothetical protein